MSKEEVEEMIKKAMDEHIKECHPEKSVDEKMSDAKTTDELDEIAKGAGI